MYSTANEAGPITFHFLSVAAHYFNTTENWKNDISHFLSNLTTITGSSRICMQQYEASYIGNEPMFKVVHSWCKTEDAGLKDTFSPCYCKAKNELVSLLINGQAVQINSQDIESRWYEDLKYYGLISYLGFPVFVNGKLWGVLGFEFTESIKTWLKTELNILEGFSGLFGRAIEKQQIEQALLLDKTYFEEVFHSAPAAIVILNQKGIVERINQEFTRLFHYQPEEIIGQKIDEILPSDYDKESAVELTGRILSGERVVHEGVRYRKDGSPVFVTIVGVQSFHNHEEPKVYSIYYDITDRVLAQEKLQESQERFKSLFESANDAIFLLKEGIVFECNARTLDIFRCTREDIIGRSAIDLSPVRQPNGIPSLNLAVKYNRAAEGHEQQSFEWLHQRPDGSQFMAEVSLNIFEWKGESFVQAIVRDISHRKRTEKLLQQRFEFIAFLSRVSADLINLDSACIDTTINEVLEYSGSFSGCSRAIIYLLDLEGIQLQLAYQWNSDHTVPNEAMEQVLISDLSGIVNQISKGESLIREVPSSAGQPEEALLAEILDLAHFRTYIIVPLTVSG